MGPSLPDIIGASSGNLYTNASVGQIAALAAFAYNLDEQNIAMKTTGGSMDTVFWGDNFIFTNETARENLVKEIYGNDLNYNFSQYNNYSQDAAWKQWNGMVDAVYEPNATTLLNYVQSQIDSGAIPAPTTIRTPTPSPSVIAVAYANACQNAHALPFSLPYPIQNAYAIPVAHAHASPPTPTATPTPTPTATPTETPTPTPKHSSGAKLSGAPPWSATATPAVSYEIYQKFIDVKNQLAYVKYLMGKSPLPTPFPSPLPQPDVRTPA